MDENAKLEIFTISTWQLAAIVVLVIAFIILYMKANRTASLKAFFLVQITIIIWLVGKILKTVSPIPEMRWSFIVLYYFGICYLEVAFLEFGYTYYRGRPFKWKTRLLLYILPTIQFIVVATNPYHYLFYSSYDFYSDEFGMLFYVHVAIVYIHIFIGIILCAIKLGEQFKYKSKGYRYLMATAILGPIILNLLYITRILQKIFYFISFRVIFDVTPIVFTWSLLLFVYATFKYEFFNLSPIMKHEIIHKLDTPICIIDTSGDILFVNEQLNDHFNFKEDPNPILNMIRLNRKQLTSNDYEASLDHPFQYKDKYYLYYSKQIQNIDGIKYIIVYNEVTAYVLAQKQLSDKNHELIIANKSLNKQIEILKSTSKIGASNFVAREMHDILGHSLVVTMKLLEVAKLTYQQNPEMALDSLEKAKTSSLSGLSEMKQVNQGKSEKTIYGGRLLKKELDTMLRRVKDSGIEVNFYLKGERQKLDEKVHDITKRVCTELVTNTLKHARANRMLISCNLRCDKVSVYFMDDGVGADELVKGNGLHGIESRLALIKGTVQFTTGKGEGFSANIEIPA